MITVAGFNTAIDRLMTVDRFEPGTVQRASSVRSYPGGKGVHVAQTIAALGEAVQLVGLTDGMHRNLIARRMSERGVLFHGVEIAGDMRCCLALRERSGRMSEVLDPGPELHVRERQQLLDALGRCIEESDAVVMSGSLPRGFDPDTYAQLVESVDQRRTPCLVDASGETLRLAAKAQPYLLKPNRDEASQLAGRDVQTLDEAIAVAVQLHRQGIALPVLTLGALGAVGFDGSDTWHAAIDIGEAANAVGSGDCLLAGMTVALVRTGDLGQALRLGVACGAANAVHEETGYVQRAQVNALLPMVKLDKIGG
ncbi:MULTISPECIES: 1-phosphofructokinase family hexose kinase [Dyella]|uniref:Phosphofructokinase n=2 Tax=Dyella TaxID=231454 RepID=A0A4R0Z2R7_9GAMM|nr:MULTISPECIES: 1-phosphofructokinase family hexose kinase [Dyella]TBR39830.1 1-phosphofructokinase family hexose kinase [Dyella terrae]TCI12590.1 1-phosphofructokinase family hexose kinase [Dyella soli]